MEQQLFRQLNALVRTQAQRDKLKHALQNDTPLDPRHDGFALENNRVIYQLQNGDKLELLMTEAAVAKMLEKEYAQSGVGKGQTVFYKHIQAQYLGVTRVAVTAFLKAQAGYALSRKAPHRTNKPIVASEKGEVFGVDLIDFWHD
jgi:hypothetical protein